MCPAYVLACYQVDHADFYFFNVPIKIYVQVFTG